MMTPGHEKKPQDTTHKQVTQGPKTKTQGTKGTTGQGTQGH